DIPSHSLVDGQYNICRSCWRHVKKDKFVTIPLLSWANGCWVGDVPPELACLSFLEEMVIARAHATKCWGKLEQRGTTSNVCIHPHEIKNIANRLPRPFDTLKDEIAVMIVSNDTEVTVKAFKRTPFLVRRQKILDALIWLKANNRFYHDLEIDMDALNGYPAED
ncbi:hypothetical protein K435DRAFT_618458, partial [Dendrothele bispora CBS 962.96]